MNLEDLRVLIHVVECGSLQSAAKSLGVTRSMVRRRLRSLEEDVGTPLLHPGTRPVRPTPSGNILVERGRTLLDQERTLLDEARAAAEEAAGLLRIVEPTGLPQLPRCYALMSAHASRPHLRIELREVEDPTRHLDGGADIVLHHGEPPRLESWITKVIARTHAGLVASPAYLEARGTPRSVEDLNTHDTLSWTRPGLDPRTWPLAGGGTIQVSPWLVSPNLPLLRLVAGGGGGILFAPLSDLMGPPTTGPLVPVLQGAVSRPEVTRLSSPNPSARDSRTKDLLNQIHEVLTPDRPDGIPGGR